MLYKQIEKRKHKPVMIISINSLITVVAEELATIITDHFVTTFSSGDCHLASWALLRVTEYFFDTKNFVNHLKFPFLLVIL